MYVYTIINRTCDHLDPLASEVCVYVHLRNTSWEKWLKNSIISGDFYNNPHRITTIRKRTLFYSECGPFQVQALVWCKYGMAWEGTWCKSSRKNTHYTAKLSEANSIPGWKWTTNVSEVPFLILSDQAYPTTTESAFRRARMVVRKLLRELTVETSTEENGLLWTGTQYQRGSITCCSPQFMQFRWRSTIPHQLVRHPLSTPVTILPSISGMFWKVLYIHVHVAIYTYKHRLLLFWEELRNFISNNVIDIHYQHCCCLILGRGEGADRNWVVKVPREIEALVKTDHNSHKVADKMVGFIA